MCICAIYVNQSSVLLANNVTWPRMMPADQSEIKVNRVSILFRFWLFTSDFWRTRQSDSQQIKGQAVSTLKSINERKRWRRRNTAAKAWTSQFEVQSFALRSHNQPSGSNWEEWAPCWWMNSTVCRGDGQTKTGLNKLKYSKNRWFFINAHNVPKSFQKFFFLIKVSLPAVNHHHESKVSSVLEACFT